MTETIKLLEKNKAETLTRETFSEGMYTKLPDRKVV